MVRHPVFVASVAIIGIPWLFTVAMGHAGSFPTLTNSSWKVQLPLLVVAAGSYFSANLCALRSYRYDTLDVEAVQPMRRDVQVAAQFLGLAGMVLVTAVMAVTYLLTLRGQAGSAGSILPFEVATSPMVTLVVGSLGLATGHLTRNVAVGAIAFAVVAVTAIAAVIDRRQWQWLTLIATENDFSTPSVPTALALRPAGWHVLWLAALAGLLCTTTLLMVGTFRRRAAIVTVPFVILGAVSGFAQLTTPPLQRTTAWTNAFEVTSPSQTCVPRGSTTYCVFPDFQSRIDAWDEIVRAQAAALPPDTEPSPLVVRQRLSLPPTDGVGFTLPLRQWDRDDSLDGTAPSIPVSTRWAAPSSQDFDQTQVLAFSLAVAYQRVTGQRPEPPPSGGGAVTLCGGQGLVILWLASATTDAGRAALNVILQHGTLAEAAIVESSTSFIAGFGETDAIRTALAADPSQLGADIRAEWKKLIDPATTLDEALTILKLPRGTAPPEGAGLCNR